MQPKALLLRRQELNKQRRRTKMITMTFIQKITNWTICHSTVCRNLLLSSVAILTVDVAAGHAQGAEQGTVIRLTQTPCQFLESEGVGYKFRTTKKADCDAINKKTRAERLAKTKVMTLKPGRYVFRVTNKNVPYNLGFWLRSKDYDWSNPLHKLAKTSVSGGGLSPGTTRDYVVNLKPGEFVYSCPLNPTPNYKLVVTGG